MKSRQQNVYKAIAVLSVTKRYYNQQLDKTSNHLTAFTTSTWVTWQLTVIPVSPGIPLQIFIAHHTATLMCDINIEIPSAHLTCSCTASQRLNTSLYFLQHMYGSPINLVFTILKIFANSDTVIPQSGSEHRWVYKFCYFQPIWGKWYKTGPQLLWNGNRKSYALYWTVTFLMTLSDLWRSFQCILAVVTLCAADVQSVSDSSVSCLHAGHPFDRSATSHWTLHSTTLTIGR